MDPDILPHSVAACVAAWGTGSLGVIRRAASTLPITYNDVLSYISPTVYISSPFAALVRPLRFFII
jgi:hypothetical protein